MTPSFSKSPLYCKAQEIFVLSRNIATYLNYDLASLQNNGQENDFIYFSGDIVQQSVSLAPEILRAERQIFSEEKYKYAASVERLTALLHKNCDRLEKANVSGKDFIKLLRKELKKFSKMHRIWTLTL